MYRFARSLVALSLVTFFSSGCGTSGSNPPDQPELYYQIIPATGGQATFTVQSLFDNNVSFVSLNNPPNPMTYTIIAPFTIALENATVPYAGTFTAIESDVTVILSEQPVAGNPPISVQGTTSAGNPTVSLIVPVPTPGMTSPPTPGAAFPEIRVDVCAPSPGTSSCLGNSGSVGTAGIPFNGSIGDSFTSRLLGNPNNPSAPPVTPTVYFFEGPQDTINVALQTVVSTPPLLVQLFINGQLSQSTSGTGNLTLRQDL